MSTDSPGLEREQGGIFEKKILKGVWIRRDIQSGFQAVGSGENGSGNIATHGFRVDFRARSYLIEKDDALSVGLFG
ncbi:hypothetical protein [Paremcibacter congregatus]|uniref:hypothetical protein n=1 Tax=Paremcibacter congregatus TaxID=2043170 RepID=UPI0030EE9906|tara:strand:- start:934 stop:1161 length:228 start_codon:yes stop_codon:yes gene_type:complete